MGLTHFSVFYPILRVTAAEESARWLTYTNGARRTCKERPGSPRGDTYIAAGNDSTEIDVQFNEHFPSEI